MRGCPEAPGTAPGNWRLVLTANLDIEALGYILAGDGSLSGMNALAAESRHGATWRYDVPYFQPASRGRLRLVNPGTGTARVTITGVDDRGAAGDGAVRVTVAARAARNLTSEELEGSDDSPSPAQVDDGAFAGVGANVTGRLGNGSGRWRLTVSSNRQLLVMSLLRNPDGHLVNLSHGEAGVSVEPPPPPPPSSAPDLVVRSPSVSDSSLTAGQSFTLRATVHNQGGRRSAATTLRYYRSSDATISTADTRVGTDAVAGLAPSGNSPESIVSRAPSRAGTYYYGACVNAVSGESNTRNNCSSGVRVRVTAPASDYWGAIAAGWQGQYCEDGYGWGASLNNRSRDAATSAAETVCRNAGLNSCQWVAAFNACGSLAYGQSATGCNLFGGTGATRSAAQSDALSYCRATYSTCQIAVDTASGTPATYCNSGAGAPPVPNQQDSGQAVESSPAPANPEESSRARPLATSPVSD